MTDLPPEWFGERAGATAGEPERVALPYGVAAGDVTSETAIVWTRTGSDALVHVAVSSDPDFADVTHHPPVPSTATDDWTATTRLTDLEPDTRYWYAVWATSGPGAATTVDRPADAEVGSFRTAPTADADRVVSLVWSGDTYGQGREPPFQVFRQMDRCDPDLFLYLGDTVYADQGTPALPDGDPQDVADYRAKYREMRESAPHLRRLLRRTPLVTMWDDHEVANNWAGTTEPRLPAARRAFTEYWPVDRSEPVTGPRDDRLYRSFRWGSALELFVCDTRQYRSDNTHPDGPGKTMLGDEQREWLLTGLADSDASFVAIASSTSLCSVSGPPEARDSWASGGSDTGFESELETIVEQVRSEVDGTVIWLTGDRHFARVVSFDPDGNGDPDFFEAVASPIGAAPRDPSTEPLDDTFGPDVRYEEGGKYAAGEFYNFGELVADSRRVSLSIYDKLGERRFGVTITDDGRIDREFDRQQQR